MPREPKEDEVLVQVDIDDDVFLKLAKMAYEEDITINDMMVKILKAQIEEDRKNLEESSSEN